RKPWLLSVNSAPGAGRRACALPKSPNRITFSRRPSTTRNTPVIPAKAGTHSSAPGTVDKWIPACAGMTGLAQGVSAPLHQLDAVIVGVFDKGDDRAAMRHGTGRSRDLD